MKEMVEPREVSEKEKDDIRTLMKFVGIYCGENHNGERTPFSFKLFDIKEIERKEVPLCPDCTRLLTYGKRRMKWLRRSSIRIWSLGMC
jgi:hypothetical protein